ncbi:MAG: hypothetical protein KOO63_15880 [Bacteroidales bacterium]|nr:hypothetical protein [Candidatus Latescibacterota bacterium]
MTGKNFLTVGVLLMVVILSFMSAASAEKSGISVRKVDILSGMGFACNGAGPMLVRADESRGRMISVNTLSSSISVIDCSTGAVTNIPLAGRAFQHLKAEALTLDSRTGDIYLIGRNCFHIVRVEARAARTVETKVQFESIAVDEATGNVFLAGRETGKLGFYKASSGRLTMKKWLDREEPLINLNATPPPPIRKVIADNSTGDIVAVDGLDPAVYLFSGSKGRKKSSRELDLPAGGRWHLAGYDEAGHDLYIVIETGGREVVSAARIDMDGENDLIVELPGFTEGVGIIWNPSRGEVYIPYDNQASVHVVDFSSGGTLSEIKVPAFGNDGSAVDLENDILYIASWAYGEIDVIDLASRRLIKRVTDLGIIPHMFTLAYDPGSRRLYFPKGASAVNGTFGAAVTWLDPVTEESGKIYTGWAPIDLIDLECRGNVLVFGSEDRFAEVRPDGSFDIHELPFDYPVRACKSPEGDIYLSYGPHQSYWPTVYIWGAKNGIMTIDRRTLEFYDRRIPRQAHEIVLDRDGILYFTQNNWGKEEQFAGRMRDQVRMFDINDRLRLGEDVEREITQRILRYDSGEHLIYLVKTGEKDEDPSVLQVIDPDSSGVVHRIILGITATDLAFDEHNIYVTGFDSDDVTIVDKSAWGARNLKTGRQPLRLQGCRGNIYVICHGDNTLRLAGAEGEKLSRSGQDGIWEIPWEGRPDNIFEYSTDMVITSYSKDAFRIMLFDTSTEKFELLHEEPFPYGDTSMDSRNVSFYMRGQFGDAVFSLTRGVVDSWNRLWINDFTGGKTFILEDR